MGSLHTELTLEQHVQEGLRRGDETRIDYEVTAARDIASVLREHCRLMVKALRRLDPLSIVLHGSYGRDEGGWVESERGLQPYNDYDLVVVVSRKEAAEEEVEAVAQALAADLGVQWVDIDQFTPRELSRLRISIKHYDLKYASKVIWGDEGVLTMIPEMDASALPLVEGEKLFFTRLWPFLGGLGKAPLDADREGECARFFRNQMAKATFAAVDAALLMRGLYHPSYGERLRRLEGGPSQQAGLQEHAKWALRERLRPCGEGLDAAQCRSLYMRTRAVFFQEMMQLEARLYRQDLETLRDFERVYTQCLLKRLKRIAHVLKHRSLRAERQACLNLAQVFLAAAPRDDGQVDAEYLARGIHWLRRVDARVSSRMGWEQAREAAARMRMQA